MAELMQGGAILDGIYIRQVHQGEQPAFGAEPRRRTEDGHTYALHGVGDRAIDAIVRNGRSESVLIAYEHDDIEIVVEIGV